MIRLSILLIAALSGVAHAQAPTPQPPPQPQPAPVVPVATIATSPLVDSGQPIILYADSSIFTGELRWKVRPSVPIRVLDDAGRGGVVCLVPPPPPGQYRFILIATGTANATDVDVADVTVGQDKPKPKPVPTPDPAPSPTPGPTPVPPTPAFAGHLHATLIFDIAGDNPSTAAVRVSTIKADLKDLDCDWYAIDAASKAAGIFAAQLARDKIAAPVVYVTDDAGNIKGSPIKAPTTAADVTDAIKAIRGLK